MLIVYFGGNEEKFHLYVLREFTLSTPKNEMPFLKFLWNLLFHMINQEIDNIININIIFYQIKYFANFHFFLLVK